MRGRRRFAAKHLWFRGDQARGRGRPRWRRRGGLGQCLGGRLLGRDCRVRKEGEESSAEGRQLQITPVASIRSSVLREAIHRLQSAFISVRSLVRSRLQNVASDFTLDKFSKSIRLVTWVAETRLPRRIELTAEQKFQVLRRQSAINFQVKKETRPWNDAPPLQQSNKLPAADWFRRNTTTSAILAVQVPGRNHCLPRFGSGQTWHSFVQSRLISRIKHISKSCQDFVRSFLIRPIRFG